MIVTTGGTVSLRGTTLAARPELAGTVLEDRLRPFANGPVTGVLQERIVRSSVDNTLAFYYRIKELTGGVVTYIALTDWPLLELGSLDMDYRIDGLGERGPATGAAMNPTRFDFSPTSPATSIALSRFMFIKMIPGPGRPVVTAWRTDRNIQLGDGATWAALLPDSFRPDA
jgi:hypothetical protein